MSDAPLAITPITGERELDFVLLNARDVGALVKVWERAASELPRWLEGLARSVLANECAEMMSELDLESRAIEDGELSWLPRATPRNAERRTPSIWFYIPNGIEWLSRRHEETVHLYLWQYDGAEREAWVKYVHGKRSTLARSGLRVLGFPDTDVKYKGRTLLSRDLDELFDPASLQTGNIRGKLAHEIESFTRTAMGVVRDPRAPRGITRPRR